MYFSASNEVNCTLCEKCNLCVHNNIWFTFIYINLKAHVKFVQAGFI